MHILSCAAQRRGGPGRRGAALQVPRRGASRREAPRLVVSCGDCGALAWCRPALPGVSSKKVGMRAQSPRLVVPSGRRHLLVRKKHIIERLCIPYKADVDGRAGFTLNTDYCIAPRQAGGNRSTIGFQVLITPRPLARFRLDPLTAPPAPRRTSSCGTCSDRPGLRLGFKVRG